MLIENLYKQIFTEGLPTSEDIVFEPILPKYRHVKMCEWTIFFVVLIVGATLAYVFIASISLWMYLAAWGVLVLWIGYVIASIYLGFPRRGFAVREKDVHYRKGWLTRSIISVPICRIQHLEVSQGMLGKLWDIAKIKIYTAGDSSSDLEISGISFEKAEQIKTLLSQKLVANE